MATPGPPAAASATVPHANAFGALRLGFAALVIVSHAPELQDGNRQREVLWRLTGATSFGELAVYAFFVISGFLIAASYLGSRSAVAYALKRVARIYPAFLVATLLCAAVVAPLGGADLALSPDQLATIGLRALTLQPPDLGSVFVGRHYPMLNGAMWTIGYEFRCYVLLAILGLLGLLRRPALILLLTLVLLVWSATLPDPYLPESAGRIAAIHPAPSAIHSRWLAALFGWEQPMLRFVAVFLTGTCFYLFRARIRFAWPGAALAAVCLAAGLTWREGAAAAAAVFGGYVIFTVALRSGGSWLARLNSRDDVSYGTYLYGWPVIKLLQWYLPEIGVVTTAALALALSCGLGWLSWRIVERPVLAAVQSRRTTRAVPA